MVMKLRVRAVRGFEVTMLRASTLRLLGLIRGLSSSLWYEAGLRGCFRAQGSGPVYDSGEMHGFGFRGRRLL